MSLLSVNLSQLKSLTLVGVKLPEPEPKAETTTHSQAEKSPLEETTCEALRIANPPPTEEIAYSRLLARNPLLEKLVKRFDLVSATTRQQISKVSIKEAHSPPPEGKAGGQTIEKPQIIALSRQALQGENSYTKEEIVKRITIVTNGSNDAAVESFNLMLQFKAIEPLSNGKYYLTGSTPF